MADILNSILKIFLYSPYVLYMDMLLIFNSYFHQMPNGQLLKLSYSTEAGALAKYHHYGMK